MQYGLAVAGISSFVLMFYFLPETSHPGTRGIDNRKNTARKLVWLNPLSALWLLRSPNLLILVSFFGHALQNISVS
jgi:hypothetical protein